MSISNNSKRGLGRGFESLIPTDLLDESFDPTAAQDQQISELRQIKVDQITADPDQPRRYFEEEGLAELAVSIKEHGVVQPIIVAPFNGGYQIVAGERRYRAAKMAGLEKMPALVRTLTDQHKLEISLIENLQRKDLNVMETATAYLKLRDQFNMSLEEIGKRVGNSSSSTVSNRLRLLKLPVYIREALAGGKMSEGQARPLIGLQDDLIKKLFEKIIKEEWTSRRVEQFIVDLKKDNNLNKKLPTHANNQPFQYQSQIENMKKKLNTDVDIRTNSKGAGKITIKFKNDHEFKRIQELLG